MRETIGRNVYRPGQECLCVLSQQRNHTYGGSWMCAWKGGGGGNEEKGGRGREGSGWVCVWVHTKNHQKYPRQRTPPPLWPVHLIFKPNPSGLGVNTKIVWGRSWGCEHNGIKLLSPSLHICQSSVFSLIEIDVFVHCWANSQSVYSWLNPQRIVTYTFRLAIQSKS